VYIYVRGYMLWFALIMENEVKCKGGNRPPSPQSYVEGASIRGGLVKTKDGLAVFIAFLSAVLFLFFGFILGVITDNPKAEENEKGNREPQKVRKFIRWIIK
jgi:hypothetical protein